MKTPTDNLEQLLDGYSERASRRLARADSGAVTATKMVAAVGASMAAASAADAEFVQMAPFASGPITLFTSSDGRSSDSRLFDLDGDGGDDIGFFVRAVSSFGSSSAKVGRQGTSTAGVFIGANNQPGNAIVVGSNPGDAKRLASLAGSAPISSLIGQFAIHFQSFSGGQVAGEWGSFDTAYLGVRFKLNGTDDVFGWIQVATSAPGLPGRPVLTGGPQGQGNQVTLINGFYTVIPEPSTGMLAGLGALALGARALRKRKLADAE